MNTKLSSLSQIDPRTGAADGRRVFEGCFVAELVRDYGHAYSVNRTAQAAAWAAGPLGVACALQDWAQYELTEHNGHAAPGGPLDAPDLLPPVHSDRAGRAQPNFRPGEYDRRIDRHAR